MSTTGVESLLLLLPAREMEMSARFELLPQLQKRSDVFMCGVAAFNFQRDQSFRPQEFSLFSPCSEGEIQTESKLLMPTFWPCSLLL